MYKIIYNEKIIDLTKSLSFYSYIESLGLFLPCDKSIATHFQGSNGKYCLDKSLDSIYPNASYIPVDENEYKYLEESLKTNQFIYDKDSLINARNLKIEELKQECDKVIYDGVFIKLKDNMLYQFELSIEDQLNLRMIENDLISSNKEAFLYHAKAQKARIFDRQEMLLIIKAVNQHVIYNTTYFNLAKNCINNMNDLEKIRAFKYGMPIPDSEAQKMLELVRG